MAAHNSFEIAHFGAMTQYPCSFESTIALGLKAQERYWISTYIFELAWRSCLPLQEETQGELEIFELEQVVFAVTLFSWPTLCTVDCNVFTGFLAEYTFELDHWTI